MKKILLRGGGDLATGIAVRLHRCGFSVIIAELPAPLSVRRKVSFSEAVYDGAILVEGVEAVRAATYEEAMQQLALDKVPVCVDPDLAMLPTGHFDAVIDARLMKVEHPPLEENSPFTIGLGPGFSVGANCHAAIETERGHHLARVMWSGSPSPDSGQPEGDPRRVFRAPCDGVVRVVADIGSQVVAGQLLAEVGPMPVYAPLDGVIRGMMRDGTWTQKGVKLGDVDTRSDASYCYTISDKAYAIAGGVLEALLTYSEKKRAS